MFDIESVSVGPVAKIKVIGVGGAGGNAINNMKSSGIYGIEFIAINTDLQHLDASIADTKLQIGASLTKGLGAGADPSIGMQSALEDKALIAGCLEGADMIFITAGMGGGTGTGATPVIAQLAKEMGILSVAIVTKPFNYEGRRRAYNADVGIKELRKHVDTLIVIPNDNISRVVDKNIPITKAFAVANDILKQAVQGISDIILVRGLVNVDFADVRTVMQNAGRAVIGMGVGKGEGAAFQATKSAIHNNLLEDTSIEDAKGALVNITGGEDLPLEAINEALSQVYEAAHKDLNLIFGVVINPEMKDEVKVTVIATGFEDRDEKVETLAPSTLWQPPPQLKLTGSKKFLDKSTGSILDSIKPQSVQASKSLQTTSSTRPDLSEDLSLDKKAHSSTFASLSKGIAKTEAINPEDTKPSKLSLSNPKEDPLTTTLAKLQNLTTTTEQAKPIDTKTQNPEPAKTQSPETDTLKVNTEDDLDIPTFLRKKRS